MISRRSSEVLQRNHDELKMRYMLRLDYIHTDEASQIETLLKLQIMAIKNQNQWLDHATDD